MSKKATKAASARFVHCVGNPAFQPDDLVLDTARQQKVREHLDNNDLYHAIVVAFGLPEKDTYTYHAMTSVSLAQVQHVVGLGSANLLHAWYREEDGTPPEQPSATNAYQTPPPPPPDTESYISIFAPSTLTPSALKAMLGNAKKNSLRACAASHLTSKRYLHPSLTAALTIPRRKTPPAANPYFDFWSWSARNLEWCGPCPGASDHPAAGRGHHVLPIFMHHFGCAAPSHEALEILRIVADGRPVADVGSGNGYWTFMLRRYGLGGAAVHPVDNMQSEWRVNWVSDTEVAEGVDWLARHDGGANMVLLLVYPVVGGGIAGGVEGGFTRDLVGAFRGDTLAVVGTQNRNGYTGFKDVTMDEYMEREHKGEWIRIAQVPLPSFPGKDEALFVFQRGERAPKEATDAA